MNDINKLKNELVKEIQIKVKNANVNGVIVAISGGIDSAVVACLAKLAFPKKHLVVFLPSNSDMIDYQCVNSIVYDFRFEFMQFDIENIEKNIINQFIHKNENFKFSLKHIGNIKSRLRSNYLYTLANLNNYLILGTTNACEFLLGFCTKYGDSNSDFNPIIGLLKSEVKILAKNLNITEMIINRKPSPSLIPDVHDEDELDFTYLQFEKYIKNNLNNLNIQNRIEKRIKDNKHKKRIIESSLFKKYFKY